jgi:hypothetical protein
MPPSTLQAASLIGKRIRWEVTLDRNRGTYVERHGNVDDAKGRNLLVDGNWCWLPDLENVTVLGPAEPIQVAP